MDLKQKSRVQWLNEGDSNTSFFHRTTTKRQSSNTICNLKTNNGQIVNQNDQISKEAIDHFQQIWYDPSIQPISYLKANECLTDHQKQ